MSDFESCNGNCQGCSSTDCGDGTATITLTLDNDETVECSILTVFEAAGRDYIALLPLDENGENQDGEVYLYRYSETEEGQPSLANIEEDEEYHIAADAFDEMLDSMQFDGEDEEEG